MEFQRDSRVIRWAYLAEGTPEQTSLCALFWRVAVITPIRIAIPLAIVGMFIYLLVLALIDAPLLVGGILVIVVGAIGTGLSIARIQRAFGKRRQQERHDRPTEPSVIFDGFRAVKGKVCPIVKIVR